MSLSRGFGAALVCLLAFPAADRADGPEGRDAALATRQPLLPPISWSRELGGFWGLELAITSVSPPVIELGPGSRSREPVEVDFAIDPVAYPDSTVRLDLYSNDVWRANFVGASSGGGGRITLFEGLPFDPESFHEMEVAVNPGNTNEVRSDREPLALAQRLLTDFGPRRPWLGGARSLLVSEELDLANERVCRTPTVLDFRLARAADVTLSFRRIEALEVDGTQQLGAEIVLIAGQRYAAG
ncbi:MAG: hypothetical protein GY722_27330, partial [bacterium]|nr:hypothetical protein [bacterium]